MNVYLMVQRGVPIGTVEMGKQSFSALIGSANQKHDYFQLDKFSVQAFA